jgi:N-acetylglucosamine-6-phosphate deacetylase
MSALVAGGLIDLQVNGGAGHDLTEDPSSVWAVGEALRTHGVAAFLPTLVSPSWAIVDRGREVLAAGPPPGYGGATPLGWHVEGPFLNPERRGAHALASLREPDVRAVTGWGPASGVRIVTLAPELPGALDVVRALVESGVVVSAGHSSATFEEARAGFEAGIRMVTHLFNAMAPLDRREPGLPGAALLDPRVTVALIPDGLHVHPAMISLVRRLAGPERLAIVSDAIAAAGLPAGTYSLAGRRVRVEGLEVRTDDGVLAGSVIGLDVGVRNLEAFAGISPEAAELAATTVPARLLGLGRAPAA